MYSSPTSIRREVWYRKEMKKETEWNEGQGVSKEPLLSKLLSERVLRDRVRVESSLDW